MIGKSAKIRHYNNLIEIKNPIKRNWFIILFQSIWMILWGRGLNIGWKVLFIEKPWVIDIFFFCFLLSWVYFGVVFLLSILDQLFGYEIITIKKDKIIVKYAIKNIGRKKEYAIGSIKNIPVSYTHLTLPTKA